MYITCTGIQDGVIMDKYGKRGEQFDAYKMPTYSLPLKIHDKPEGTVSFVIVIDDKDAYALTKGFVWNHWLVANLTRDELSENESLTATDFVQGVNSFLSGGKMNREQASFYGGMAPPDCEHTYDINVYALDTMLDLQNGFYLNELYRQIKEHVIGECTLSGTYAN